MTQSNEALEARGIPPAAAREGKGDAERPYDVMREAIRVYYGPAYAVEQNDIDPDSEEAAGIERIAAAVAEARRGALEEAALLILDCNTLRGDKLADILATGIRALNREQAA